MGGPLRNLPSWQERGSKEKVLLSVERKKGPAEVLETSCSERKKDQRKYWNLKNS